jgi:hypothetical protein
MALQVMKSMPTLSKTNSNCIGRLNDLWKFDGNNWTWISGADVISEFGIYGEKGSPDPSNMPSAREYALGWTDLYDHFWLFGGSGPLGNTKDYSDMNFV